jgi:hypothetical protein
MVSRPCPHQDAAPRLCNGCDQDTTGAGWRYCEGSVVVRVTLDTDEHAGWGVPYCVVEQEELTCGCNLSDAEWEAARVELVDER